MGFFCLQTLANIVLFFFWSAPRPPLPEAGLDWPGAHCLLPRPTLPLCCLWVDKPLPTAAKRTPRCPPFSLEAIYCFQRNQPSKRSPVLRPLLRTSSSWLRNANIWPDTTETSWKTMPGPDFPESSPGFLYEHISQLVFTAVTWLTV